MRPVRAASATAGGAELAAFAALLAERTRAEICLLLVDGRAWTAGELARATRIAPPTATEHLNRLIAGGLLTEYRQGRHRYLRLANREVAALLETLLAHIGPPATRPSSLRAATVEAALASGRTCYDHLAGRLGVTLTEAMIVRGLLDEPNGLALTDQGSRWFAGDLGMDLSRPARNRRPLVRPCIDWTERRPHLGGAAGAHLYRRARDLEWIHPTGTGRAIRVTPAGRTAWATLLGIDPQTWDQSTPTPTLPRERDN
ncbi:winged helix-turn-helix transcriptional regulator [Nocardia sp. 2]|uniref:Winged helix-turn-helix transcriptional regulator n=2 Tax=Nocardia acididurans TaxID=2802282 RepID=A0ABS1MBK4_9NOCA|nr:winged helix-turn-helix transcriptional regulator [Nocardia acididurans]